MKIYLKDVTINSILKANVSSNDVMSHVKLVYPTLTQDGTVIYDAEIDVDNKDYTISNKREGCNESVIIDIHPIGSIQIDRADFSSIVTY